MVMNNKTYEQHSFKSFLEKYHVVIPMVQRDYAQGRTTDDVKRVRERFLDAIKGYLNQPKGNNKTMKLDFVYGEKEVVWSRTEVNKLDRIIVTPLDGQQRLTTLYLLHWYAAKQCNIPEEEYKFLSHFSYDIRPSSRDFCTHLIEYTPDFNSPFQNQLKDQHWFMGDWSNDPTIMSMMVMLDAIKNKFEDVSNLWYILTREDELRIVFYYLPLADNGLSDELYIKMNSRGKKLTAFEHFKAEYENLYERDTDEACTLNHCFDVEWPDVFFPYRDKNYITDNEFMRYFFYISHILCYQQDIEKSDNEFDLINKLYKDSSKAYDNRKYMEAAFNCWHSVLTEYDSVDAFFAKYLSGTTYEDNKVATFKTANEYRENQNFFSACIKLYQVNNNFSYGDFLFLYGIITYLINKKDVEETEFIVRLRILRNLIWNSKSGEIRSEYMKDLLSEVNELMLKGTINSTLTHRFNGFQEAEEREKQKKQAQLDIKALHKLEDHALIYGHTAIIGLDNLYLVDTFTSLFSDSPDFIKIHRGMLAIGDYRQKISNHRYYMANHNKATWTQLFHKSRSRKNFEDTKSALLQLLQRIKAGESLDTIIKAYLDDQEKLSNYDWRCYFVKYPDMLRGAYGELEWNEPYDCITLNKHQFNGQHWNPFLNVICQKLNSLLDRNGKRLIQLGNYGERLSIQKPISYLAATNTGFTYHCQNAQEDWNVNQSGSIDKEDRIAFAVEKIKELIQQS